MKIYILFLIISLSTFINIYGQYERSDNYERDPELSKRDEYLGNGEPIGGYTPSSGCDCKDFNFNYGFYNVISNFFLTQEIQRKRYNRWIDRQNSLIKEYLERRFRKKFSNFNEARRYLMERVDGGSITYNVYPNFKNRVTEKYNSTRRDRSNSLKKLKLLKFRENEIKNRKINTSFYPNEIIGRKKLIQYRSIDAINRAFSAEFSKFRNFDVSLKGYKSLMTSAIYTNEYAFADAFFEQKEAFYNKFNSWDRLNMMAYLIGIENGSIKIEGPYLIHEKFQKFNDYHNNNFDKIELLASKTPSKKTFSVYDKNYWVILLKNHFKSKFWYKNHAKALHQKLMMTQLQKDLNAASINSNSAVDFIIGDLNITNSNQREWLNNISYNEANKIKGNILMSKAQFSPDLDIREVYEIRKARDIARIKNGGLVVKMAKELNLSTSIRKFLYENEGVANGIREEWNRTDKSSYAQKYIKAQIDLNKIELKFKFKPKAGKLNNRDDQKYTHFARSGEYNMYQLEDGSRILESPNQLNIDADGHFSYFGLENSSYKYHYIKFPGEHTWSRYLLKQPNSTADELEILFKLGAKEGVVLVGRYILPVEDIKVIIDGKDFDGQQVSRWKAAGGVIFCVVPVGKVGKVVKLYKVTKNVERASTFITKVGRVTIVKTGIKGFRVFTSGNFRHNLGKLTGKLLSTHQAHHVLPQKFRTFFSKKGINIDNPIFGAWWEKKDHLKNAYKYNQEWQKFISDYPNASQDLIFDFARHLMKKYGVPINF